MTLFLDWVRPHVCHPEAVALLHGAVVCRACQAVPIPDVYAWINQPHEDFFRSSQLAQAYAAATGDEHVPMSFPLSHVEGLYDTVVVGQPLFRVRQSIRFLRALNAPFTTPCHEDPSATIVRDADTFLADFLHMVSAHRTTAEGSTDERIALNALMKSMHDLVSAKDAVNPFETYFRVLVPYVKQCLGEGWTPFVAEPEHPNLARELRDQLIRSHLIRQLFGRYCLPLDVIHVMVSCYACSSQLEVVGNWAIDFLVRICRGDFSWQRYSHCGFVQAMHRLVHAEFHHKRNAHYYWKVVKPLMRGEAIEQYSELWVPLHEVQALLKRKFVIPGTPQDVLDVAFSHCFPAVLFQDAADQLGFTMGFNHLVMSAHRRSGQLPKGAHKKARLIHDVVRRFVTRVREFDASGSEGRPIWNLDMLKLFFASDPHFQEEIMKAIRILVVEEEEE